MTKLRNRLLVLLVLAAVGIAAAGIGVASARSFQRRPASWQATASTIRPAPGPCAGEPDPSGSGAPHPVVKPALLAPQPNLWLAQLWMHWKTRGQFVHPRGK